MSPAECKAVNEAAKKIGDKLSEWVRKAMLGPEKWRVLGLSLQRSLGA